jgi:ApbE superfamily uncharacterized protein (UPF0280 family)
MMTNPEPDTGSRPSAMAGFQSALIGQRQRLHIQHGPIDLVIDADGPGREALFEHATAATMPVLSVLVKELDRLRAPFMAGRRFTGPVARRMQSACRVAGDTFVTPMAAVAGSVADHVLAAMMDDEAARDCSRISVNNGGDIAFWTKPGATTRAQIAGLPTGLLSLAGSTRWRGMASSGWGGRSHSLGIADSVTVLAESAALADITATLIANDVDLPDHPLITRQLVDELDAASDLAGRLVTTGVPWLEDDEIARALAAGCATAAGLMQKGGIAGAVLVLQGRVETVGLAAGLLPEQLELDRIGSDKTGPDKTGPDKTGPDKTGPDKIEEGCHA